MRNSIVTTNLRRLNAGTALTAVAAVVFFAIIALLFTFPVGDGDFFWHLKTGQWIWEHKALPNFDPFSFTTATVTHTAQQTERILLILKQYWLGQLAFFGIWQTWGEAGIVALRAIIYCGILLLLYHWTKQHRDGVIPLVTVFVVGNVLLNYANERPQLFAYAFFVIMLYLQERILAREQGIANGDAAGLCMLMLVWSNCHGSYILGLVLLGSGLAAHGAAKLHAREPINGKAAAAIAGAMLCTLLNPTGLSAFSIFFGLKQDYTSRITEYVSPLTLAFKHHVFDYYFWCLAILTLVIIIVRIRRISWVHLAMLAPLLYLAMTGVRYIPFFVLAAPLVTRYLPPVQFTGKFALAPLCAILVWGATADYRNVLKFREEKAFPTQAATFLRTAKPQGHMFNFMPWGGYLMCYTPDQVFVDGRGLIEDFVKIHDNVLSGIEWRKTLDTYQIQTIVIPGTDALSTSAFPILLQLLQEPAWQLIYLDDVALIFLRDTPQNQALLTRYAISKDRIPEHITARWKWQSTFTY
jgi:hypothetical protein